MNENETYGIEFKAIVDKFKSKMKNLANDIRNFGKEAEENATVTPKILNTGYEKQIEYVKDQMDTVMDQINAIKFDGKMGNLSGLEAEYERLSNKLEDLNEKQAEFNGELEETDKKSKHINLGSLFDKSIAKIRRFTFYLLGARSVFSLFMKYQGIYYQYNEQLQYQSELSQNAIALSLAPAFEFLGNVIAYASIAFAKFIELLTGVNVLSKVSTKGIRDYNKGLKETQTLLSGIDEITNLTMPTGTGLASQYQALDEFKKKIKEVEDWFKTNPVMKWISEKLIPAVKDVYNFISDHWDVFKYIFGGVAISALVFSIGIKLAGVAAAIGTVGAIGGVASAGTGLAGLASVLGYLATFTGIVIGISVLVKESADLFKLLEELREVREMQTTVEDQLKQDAKEMVDLAKQNVKEMSNLTEESDEWKKRVVNVKSLLDSAIYSIQAGRDEYTEYIPAIKDIVKELDSVTNEDYTAKINLAIEKGEAERQANSFFGRLGNNLKSTWNNFLINAGRFIGSNSLILHFGIHEKGLDYVPYDNYPALLHKGETVVPAKYNPTIHSVGNDYTNSLLETLVMKMDDLSRRPNEFIIDGKKFANATYGLYEDERSRQNYMEGVVVK